MRVILFKSGWAYDDRETYIKNNFSDRGYLIIEVKPESLDTEDSFADVIQKILLYMAKQPKIILHGDFGKKTGTVSAMLGLTAIVNIIH